MHATEEDMSCVRWRQGKIAKEPKDLRRKNKEVHGEGKVSVEAHK